MEGAAEGRAPAGTEDQGTAATAWKGRQGPWPTQLRSVPQAGSAGGGCRFEGGRDREIYSGGAGGEASDRSRNRRVKKGTPFLMESTPGLLFLTFYH